MYDFYVILELLFTKPLNFLAVVVLAFIGLWAAMSRWPRKWRIGSVAVIFLIILFFLQGMYFEYYLIALGEEDDAEAELAYNTLKTKLSDHYLKKVLVNRRRDKNEQFYLALMAAERGLQIENAKYLYAPGFFGTNNYSRFSQGLYYPLSYRDFAHEYQIALREGRVASKTNKQP